MNGAPRIDLVVVYSGQEEATRVMDGVARQTYRDVALIWVSKEQDDSSVPGEFIKPPQLASHLKKSSGDMVFLWPRHGDLKEAALEKMVLALHLAPAFDGLTDAGRGKNGLLLRNRSKIFPGLEQWLDQDEGPQLECQNSDVKLCYLQENLGSDPSLSTLRKAESGEAIFRELPTHFENYQQIPVDPVWPMAREPVDGTSVLFLVSSLPMGGACKFTLDVVEQLKARGFRVIIATTAYYSNPWLDEFLRVIPDVFVLPHLASGIDFPRLIVHLARSRRCGRVVISHSMLGYQLLPYLRGELPDIAFLDYTHIEYETEWPHGGYAQLSVNRQPLLDRAIVSSAHLRQWMMEKGADGEFIQVCHTNVDSSRWAPDPEARARDRRELGFDEKTTLILYPCRIAEQKRPALMYQVIAALSEATREPFVVVVAGDGPLLPALQKHVEEHKMEKYFKFLGAIPLQRMAAMHNAADIFFLPSRIEGISLALFEAMALESVPVVSDVGGQRELITPPCGHLVPLGEPGEEMAAYIRALKGLLENPRQRRQKASACRERVRKYFDLEQMATNFVEAMNQAAQRHLVRKPLLPEASVCRDLATLAIDHLRLIYEGNGLLDRHGELQGLLAKQQKIIAKLQQRFATDRAVT
jgi:glycosyltransferase involved in cell wall biosynthesis